MHWKFFESYTQAFNYFKNIEEFDIWIKPIFAFVITFTPFLIAIYINKAVKNFIYAE